MRRFVRAAELSCDTYTSYWDSVRHEWGSLENATVFDEDALAEWKAGKCKTYAPTATFARWDELPPLGSYGGTHPGNIIQDLKDIAENADPIIAARLLEYGQDIERLARVAGVTFLGDK